VKVQLNVEVPEVVVVLNVTVVGLSIHGSVVGTVKEIVPANPFVLATVIVEIAAVPVVAETVIGEAVTVKVACGGPTLTVINGLVLVADPEVALI